MRALLVVLLLAAVLPPLVASAPADVEFYTSPENPSPFQPFFEGNQPARVVINVIDENGEAAKNVLIRLKVTHVKGIFSGKLLHSGFPYLEGKDVLGGEFFAPDGVVEFDYIFPIRGEYAVSVEVLPAGDSEEFEPLRREFSVQVKEWGYQVRNAAILVLMMLSFGIALGVIFGKAGVRLRT